jgi:hypothetical protein
MTDRERSNDGIGRMPEQGGSQETPRTERGASGDPSLDHHPDGYVPPERPPSPDYLAHIEQVRNEIKAFTDEDFEEMLRHIEAGEPMELPEVGMIDDKILIYRLKKAAEERLGRAQELAKQIEQRYGIDVDGDGLTNAAKAAWRRMQNKDFSVDMERYRAMHRKGMNVVERANILRFKVTDPENYARFHEIEDQLHELEQEIRAATGVEARDIMHDALEPKERRAVKDALRRDPDLRHKLHFYEDDRRTLSAMMDSSGIELERLPQDDDLVDDSAIR